MTRAEARRLAEVQREIAAHRAEYERQMAVDREVPLWNARPYGRMSASALQRSAAQAEEAAKTAAAERRFVALEGTIGTDQSPAALRGERVLAQLDVAQAHLDAEHRAKVASAGAYKVAEDLRADAAKAEGQANRNKVVLKLAGTSREQQQKAAAEARRGANLAAGTASAYAELAKEEHRKAWKAALPVAQNELGYSGLRSDDALAEEIAKLRREVRSAARKQWAEYDRLQLESERDKRDTARRETAKQQQLAGGLRGEAALRETLSPRRSEFEDDARTSAANAAAAAAAQRAAARTARLDKAYDPNQPKPPGYRPPEPPTPKGPKR